jgi:hypothetical protein
VTILLVIVFVIPSKMIFQPLGAAGSPGQMFGMVLLLLWIVRQVIGRPRFGGPMIWAMLGFVASILASYIAAAVRPIEAADLTTADRGLLTALGWLGIFLTVSDGILTRQDLLTLMRRLVAGGGFLATFGLVQFFTSQQLTNYIKVPGLSEDSNLLQLSARGGFNRPAGTAIHPIEFGAVLTMILPIALYFALSDTNRGMVRRWYPLAAIALAVPISISRSAVVSAAIVLIMVLPALAPYIRRRAYLALVVLGATVYVIVPGLLGTITGLFTGISQDASATSRTGSYALAEQMFERAPLFGRGFRTFTPAYRIFDNQYLLSLVETGIVGVCALLALSVVSVTIMFKLRPRALLASDRLLAVCVAAGIAAATVSSLLYDALGFPMDACVFFIVLACAGVFYRTAPRRQPQVDADVAVMDRV